MNEIADNGGSLDDVAERIRTRYTQLTPAERRIADLILASPQMMVGFTLPELAQRAHVAKATVSRFVTKLGFSGFDDFRRVVRDGQAYGGVGSPLHLLNAQPGGGEGELQTLVGQTLKAEIANLEATYADLSPERLEQAVELLTDSERVIFADFRKQYALAYYAATLFGFVRPNVSLLPVVAASPADPALDLGPPDLVVMFPFRRPLRDTDVLSQAIDEAGATLITVGDVWPNPAAERAKLHFRCRTEGVGGYDSFVTPISLINLLFTATASRLGAAAHERLQRFERQHVLFGTLVPGYDSGISARSKLKTRPVGPDGPA